MIHVPGLYHFRWTVRHPTSPTFLGANGEWVRPQDALLWSNIKDVEAVLTGLIESGLEPVIVGVRVFINEK